MNTSTARGWRTDPKAFLFQTYSRATGQLTGTPLPQANAYAMILAARQIRRHHHARRQPHVSRHGRHRLSEERRNAGTRRADGKPCLDTHDAALDRRAEEVTLDEVERILFEPVRRLEKLCRVINPSRS